MRFVDTDLETFPAGGHVKVAKDQAARSVGMQHVALWPSAAKGGEICFTARGMLHIAGGLVAALKHRGAGGDGGIRLALTDGGKAAMRAAHVVLCGASARLAGKVARGVTNNNEITVHSYGTV